MEATTETKPSVAPNPTGGRRARQLGKSLRAIALAGLSAVSHLAG